MKPVIEENSQIPSHQLGFREKHHIDQVHRLKSQSVIVIILFLPKSYARATL